MLPCCLFFAIAAVAFASSLNIDESAQPIGVLALVVAICCFILSLAFAPIAIKVVLLGLLLASNKFIPSLQPPVR